MLDAGIDISGLKQMEQALQDISKEIGAKKSDRHYDKRYP